MNGGTLRIDTTGARHLLIHEQDGRYSTDELGDLADAVGAPTLGEFLTDPYRWLAGFAIEPRMRRPGDVPLPSAETLAEYAAALPESGDPLAYLTEVRGLSRRVIRKARIGWDARTGRLVFPMYSANGELVAVKYRHPETGAQMRSGAGSGRAWPLYPRVYAPDNWVLIVAGEFDALRGRSVGLPASSVTCGKATWRDEWTAELRGLRVVVTFDNNEADAGEAVVGRLGEAGVNADRLDLRRLGLDAEKGDLSDYLAAGGDPARLVPRSRLIKRRRAVA